jgi:hypothetical protein
MSLLIDLRSEVILAVTSVAIDLTVSSIDRGILVDWTERQESVHSQVELSSRSSVNLAKIGVSRNVAIDDPTYKIIVLDRRRSYPRGAPPTGYWCFLYLLIAA